MTTQRAKPQDFTGRQRQQLQAKHAEEIKAREGEIAMVTAAAATLDDVVIDVVRDEPVQELAPSGEVVYVEPMAKTIRVNSTIENMTFGVGNNYNFEEGKQYRVPAAVADHLEELGYVWH